eukprot:gene11506-24050_t
MNSDSHTLINEEAWVLIIGDHSGNIRFKSSVVDISLYTNKLVYQTRKSDKQTTVMVNDIIGKSFFDLCSTSHRRAKCSLEFTFQTNEETCKNWNSALNSLTQGIYSNSELDSISFIPPKPRKFLIFVNPVSGQQKSMHIWENITKPMLKYANIEYELLITTRKNHGYDYIQQCNYLEQFSIILIIGGDGIIFEIINGISVRTDATDILQNVAIAPIPSGTGNGLVKSILFESNEKYSIINAIFVAIKGKPSAIDLSTVTTLNHSYTSFLLLGWGLISDIDILSEPMRWMGELRLYLGAIRFILEKRLYNGRISILPPNTHHNELSYTLPPLNEPLHPISGCSDWIVIESDFILVWILQTSHCTSTIYSGPGIELNDGLFTILIVRNTSRVNMLKLLLAIDNGSHINHPCVESYKAIAYRLEPGAAVALPATTTTTTAQGAQPVAEPEPSISKGLYTLDGEVIEYGPIQANICRSAARVIKL